MTQYFFSNHNFKRWSIVVLETILCYNLIYTRLKYYADYHWIQETNLNQKNKVTWLLWLTSYIEVLIANIWKSASLWLTKIIFKNGPTSCPACLWDLTPCDFFPWGYVKLKVHAKQSKNNWGFNTKHQKCSSSNTGPIDTWLLFHSLLSTISHTEDDLRNVL